ncbi:unnamed protein product [Brassica oleracea]|uniref:Uncharacterized protein n=1 Tax=Brassica oleracea TaxID=3712 RepID=A0A3P6EUH3_BRAOL|nr:unnamed protein product [Brassica oleracea]
MISDDEIKTIAGLILERNRKLKTLISVGKMIHFASDKIIGWSRNTLKELLRNLDHMDDDSRNGFHITLKKSKQINMESDKETRWWYL